MKTYPPQSSFVRPICAQTQDLQIFKGFDMSQMNPKEVFHNTAYSVQLPYLVCQNLFCKQKMAEQGIFCARPSRF